LADYRAAERILGQEQDALIAAEDLVVDCEEAQKIAQLVAQTVQQQAHARLAKVVSQCLSTVFDEPYEFKMIFEQKRGRTECRLVFVRNGLEVDPMSAAGGGVVDVASFALRLSCILLAKPPVRRLLVMDEPFKFLSEEYRGRIRTMLEQLSEELGVQFLMVTHIDQLKTGTVVEL